MRTAALRLMAGAALLFPLQVAHAAEDMPLAEVMAFQREMITLDTHLDTPESVDRPGWSIMERHDMREDYTQVDVPRMKDGELDGGFWAIYTPQGPLGAEHYAKVRDFAMLRGLSIRLMIAANPEQFELALTADDTARINAEVLVPRNPVWVQIELKQHNAESFARFEALVMNTPEVTECVAVGGGVDYLVKFEARTIDSYQRLMDKWLVSDAGIERYFTYIVTKTVKHAPIGVDTETNTSL